VTAAENDSPMPKMLLDHQVDWQEIEKELVKAAKAYLRMSNPNMKL
jgi:hypothetical protein